MNCDRCHRPLKHALELAGLKLGRECRRAVMDAVLLPLQPAAVEPDPRQVDFLRAPDLFAGMEAQQ